MRLRSRSERLIEEGAAGMLTFLREHPDHLLHIMPTEWRDHLRSAYETRTQEWNTRGTE